jgi:hypothetical protein
VRGRIDAIVLTTDGPVIRDYKSGVIFEAGQDRRQTLKEAYKTQIRMYAALYAATSGTWPARLEVVPILGNPERVTFTAESSEGLVRAARKAMDEVNNSIQLGGPREAVYERLARPSPDVCITCMYRPGCGPYRRAATAEARSWPRDAWGRLKKQISLAGDRKLIEVDSGDVVVRVRGLTAGGRHPALSALKPGDSVAIFNGRGTGAAGMLAESSMTVLYKVPAAD